MKLQLINLYMNDEKKDSFQILKDENGKYHAEFMEFHQEVHNDYTGVFDTYDEALSFVQDSEILTLPAFTIDYGNGNRKEVYDVSNYDYEEIKRLAVENASYTQNDIVIYNYDEKPIFKSTFYAIDPAKEDDSEPIAVFGEYGFYDEWETLDDYYNQKLLD